MSCREHFIDMVGCLKCHESRIGIPDNNIAASKEEDYAEAVRANNG